MTKISTLSEPALMHPSMNATKTENLKNQALGTEKEVDKAASGFEALLLHKMLQEMWSTSSEDGLLGENSNQSMIFRDMFNQAVADEVVKGEGIGVKKFLKKELSKQGLAASKEGDGKLVIG
jgi:Rod binding domain-containing protein